MSAEKNKALVRRFLAAHAKGDLDTLEQMLAPDFVDHNLMPGEEPGREGYLQSTAEYHAAYSESRYVIEKLVMRLSLKSESTTISTLDLLYEHCRSLHAEIQHPNEQVLLHITGARGLLDA
jgi:SnoaL-like domain